jgi:hypothetical protein
MYEFLLEAAKAANLPIPDADCEDCEEIEWDDPRVFLLFKNIENLLKNGQLRKPDPDPRDPILSQQIAEAAVVHMVEMTRWHMIFIEKRQCTWDEAIDILLKQYPDSGWVEPLKRMTAKQFHDLRCDRRRRQKISIPKNGILPFPSFPIK